MKYGRYEYERTFLVNSDILDEGFSGVKKITDTYLTGTQLRLRVVEEDGAFQYKLTQKQKVVPARVGVSAINTLYLTKAEYNQLATLPGYHLGKKRYILIKAGVRIGVDEIQLQGERLYLAEIEYDTEQLMRKDIVPFCFKQEVTNDPMYSGLAVAKLYAEQML